MSVQTILHPVSDLAKAKPIYAALLGIDPQMDTDYYVDFYAEGQHIALVPRKWQPSLESPLAHWHVDDIRAKVAELVAAGAVVKEDVHDVGGGRLIATVTDPDGNVLGLLEDAS